MMIDDLLYDLSDVAIISGKDASVFSKTSCITRDANNKLPLFVRTSDIKGIDTNPYYSILTGDFSLEDKLSLMHKAYVSFSFDDFYRFIVNRESRVKISEDNFYIYLDTVAPGNTRVFEAIAEAKKVYGNQISIVIGNVFSPKIHRALLGTGADFVLLGGNLAYYAALGISMPMGYLLAKSLENTKEIPVEFLDEDGNEQKRVLPRLIVEDSFTSIPRFIKALAMGASYGCVSEGFLKDNPTFLKDFEDSLKDAFFITNTTNLEDFANVEIGLISQRVYISE